MRIHPDAPRKPSLADIVPRLMLGGLGVPRHTRAVDFHACRRRPLAAAREILEHSAALYGAPRFPRAEIQHS
jgi:hypothetical protein